DWLTPRAGTVFFASTSEAYAGAVSGTLPVPTPENVPLSIGDIENPRFAYAASKILGEAAVIHGARARRVPYVVGRFHNVYGPRPRGAGAQRPRTGPGRSLQGLRPRAAPRLLLRHRRRRGDDPTHGDPEGRRSDRPHRQRRRGGFHRTRGRHRAPSRRIRAGD